MSWGGCGGEGDPRRRSKGFARGGNSGDRREPRDRKLRTVAETVRGAGGEEWDGGGGHVIKRWIA